jgi:hypothetical protein
MTPTSCCFAESRQVRLHRDEVEARGEALGEGGILAEVVGHEHHVDQVVVECVLDALGEPTAVARQPAPADLPLLARERHELRPLRVADPVDGVDGVVEVHVDVIGAETPQAGLERRHQIRARLFGTRHDLAGQDHLVANALQGPAQGLLGASALVALGGVEVGDAPVEDVAHERLVARERAPAEADVGDLESGAPEPDLPPHARGIRGWAGAEARDAERHTAERRAAQELASIDPVPVVHRETSRRVRPGSYTGIARRSRAARAVRSEADGHGVTRWRDRLLRSRSRCRVHGLLRCETACLAARSPTPRRGR